MASGQMRTPIINESLRRTISVARLGKYLAAHNNDIEGALTAYERNTKLSEAFYTPLQSLEICFRNTLHERMSDAYGSDWTTSGNAPLLPASQNVIADALTELQKTIAWPSNDAIVAELRFAFWVGLLGPGYDSTIWRKTLFKGFHATGPKKRSIIHGRLNAIRRFRNRVAHHEPIFNRDVLKVHDEVIEAIGWMCPHTKAWTEHHSHFMAVFNS